MVVLNELNAAVDSIRAQYVPDRREDVYEVDVVVGEGKLLLRGATSVLQAKTGLLTRARQLAPGVVDSIRLLPDENLSGDTIGVVNVSVADLHADASFRSETVTQQLLGDVLQILQKRGEWFRVKAPDGYVAWIHGKSFVAMNREMYANHQNQFKIIFTDYYGFAYATTDENGQHVSDLVFGNVMQWNGDDGKCYHVSYPDGRQAYILKAQSRRMQTWKASVQLTAESILQKALSLKGIPYMWGGTSVKAMDCSGFTKTVYLMHGIVLQRDASQQVTEGLEIDISAGYDLLKPADLLFFGTKADGDRPERVRHVAIYLGNREFIHASGFVRISSLDPQQPHFDEVNTRELIYARRMLRE
jgi:hypothetical protein